MNEEIQNRKVARRRLLRRAGTVAAGVAGAGVASAVVATPANAAAGDPLVSGQTNSSGTATTTVTNNNAANPTLALGNSAAGGAQLQLQLNPATTYQNVGTTPGALTYTEDGTIYVNRPNGYPDYLRTLVNSTTVESFPPVRVLDTRTGGNRTGAMLNPEVLDADGYIGTGQVLNLNLDPITLWAYTLFCNITVIGGPNIGYMSIFPYGAGVPNTSNVNFGANSVAVNFGVTGIGIAPGANNVISIYAQTKAIVIIDAAALVVNSREDIIAPGANGLRAGGLPERVRPEHLLRRTSA